MTDLVKSTERDTIVAAALDLFAVRGYDGTTIEEIGEYADVEPNAVGRHFRDKDDVLRDILSPTLRRIDRILDRHDSHRTDGDTATLVEALIDAIADSGPRVASLLDDPAVSNQVYASANDSFLTERIELALAKQAAKTAPSAAVPKSVSRTARHMRAACAAAAIPTAITAWQENNPAAPIIDREARQTIVDIVLAIIMPAGPPDAAR